MRLRYHSRSKMKIRSKYLCVILGIVFVYLILTYIYLQVLTVSFKHVVVHIDFKGAPPKLKYLASLLPMFKRLGVNGILMEYEDSFPYQGALASLSSKKPYDRKALEHFLKQASKLRIEIIPLIQTFGHMEHVLKLKQYQHLREVLKYPDSICPSTEDSITLIKDMLQQIISFHENITPLKHIHIGCDEVYQLNKCQKCQKRNLTNRNLFIDHVRTVKTLVYNFNPSITVLMWDDHFRQNVEDQWDSENLIKLESMEPVYWDYSRRLKYTFLVTLIHYHKTFKHIWIATAFKGADYKESTLPILKARFENHYNWLNFIVSNMFAGEKAVFNFEGVIITGWSRFNHFAPQCELLPASIPSLVMNLLLIETFRNGIYVSDTLLTPNVFFDKHIARKLEYEMKCEHNVLNYEYIDKVSTCKYKTSLLMFTLIQYNVFMRNIDATFNKIDKQIKNLKKNHIEINSTWYKNSLNYITQWETEMYLILINYYDNYFIKEYVSRKVYAAKQKMKIIRKFVLQDERKLNFRTIKRK